MREQQEIEAKGEYMGGNRKNRGNSNQSKIHEINLEQGRPTVDVAMKYLEHGLARAKSYGYTVIKLIHGYGSSGSGGKIKTATRKELEKHKAAGKICEFVAGENFSMFDAATQRIIAACPDITRDSDYSRGNHGITIVLI